MRRRLACALGIGLIGMTAMAQSAAETRFEVYSLAGAEMESTLEAVQAFVGDAGQVTPDPVHQRLLVVTTPDRHARIADLMKQLALPPRNVAIEVQIDAEDRDESREASVRGSGEIELGPGGLEGSISLRPRLVHRSTTRTGSTTQLLLVGSGREASLRVGETVPYLQWIMDYSSHGGGPTPQIAWQEVGSFLVVQPTLIGDGPMMRIRLIPELRGRISGKAEQIRFTSLSTDLLARDGEPIEIGGLNEHRDFYDRFLVGGAQDGSARRLNIRLVPRIQSPAHSSAP